MIINLKEGVVTIEPMVVPELVHKLAIQYVYEKDTDHLLPCLTIDNKKFIGDRVFIDTEELLKIGKISIKVELLDGTMRPVKTYKNVLPNYVYCIVGTKPVRPDLDEYIHSLKQENENLRNVIEEMKSIGEVI